MRFACLARHAVAHRTERREEPGCRLGQGDGERQVVHRVHAERRRRLLAGVDRGGILDHERAIGDRCRAVRVDDGPERILEVGGGNRTAVRPGQAGPQRERVGSAVIRHGPRLGGVGDRFGAVVVPVHQGQKLLRGQDVQPVGRRIEVAGLARQRQADSALSRGTRFSRGRGETARRGHYQQRQRAANYSVHNSSSRQVRGSLRICRTPITVVRRPHQSQTATLASSLHPGRIIMDG